MSEHRIKVEPPYFVELLSGRKPFEVRRNDRGYQTGDTLILVEQTPRYGPPSLGLTRDGRELYAEITYVYTGDPRFGGHGGLQPGYVVLGLEIHTARCNPAELPTRSSMEGGHP